MAGLDLLRALNSGGLTFSSPGLVSQQPIPNVNIGTSANFPGVNASSISGGTILGLAKSPPTGGSRSTTTPSQPSQPQAPQGPNLDAIRSVLEEKKRLARDKISSAGAQKDYLLNYLKEQYGGLQTQAQEKSKSALDTLGQEGTNLANIYARAQGDQRRRTANAEVANRQQARAMNRLDSSFYDSIQAGNRADLSRGLGVLGSEQAGKEAALETRKTDTQKYFENLQLDLSREQADQEHQAQAEYQQALQEAEALDRAGVMDFNVGAEQAQQQYQSRLDRIQEIVGQMALQAQAIAPRVAAQSGNINAFAPVDESLSGILGNNAGLNSVLSRVLPGFSGAQTGGVDLATLLGLSQRPQERPYGI